MVVKKVLTAFAVAIITTASVHFSHVAYAQEHKRATEWAYHSEILPGGQELRLLAVESVNTARLQNGLKHPFAFLGVRNINGQYSVLIGLNGQRFQCREKIGEYKCNLTVKFGDYPAEKYVAVFPDDEHQVLFIEDIPHFLYKLSRVDKLVVFVDFPNGDRQQFIFNVRGFDRTKIDMCPRFCQ